jgi:hypothetical protein
MQDPEMVSVMGGDDVKSGQHVGVSRGGDVIGEGKVAERSGRWWSWNYWFGHWDERNTMGEYRPDGTSQTYSTSGRKPQPLWKRDDQQGQWTPRSPVGGARRISERSREATEYQAYLEAQHSAAESATHGEMVNRAGRRRGVSARTTWFSGRNGSLTYATEELRGHFSDHGRPLTNTQWRAQGTQATARKGNVRVRVRRRAA